MEFGIGGGIPLEGQPHRFPQSKSLVADSANNFTFLSSQRPPAPPARPRRVLGRTAAFLQSLNIRPNPSRSRLKSSSGSSNRESLRSPPARPGKGAFLFAHKNQDMPSAEKTLGSKFLVASGGELTQLNSILIKGIPPHFLNQEMIRQHFGAFGAIKKINCNPSKEYAVIHYGNHEAAKMAKLNGLKVFPNCPDISIYWTKSSKKRDLGHPTDELEEGEIVDDSPVKRKKRPLSQDRQPPRNKKVPVENREKLLPVPPQPVDSKSKNLEQLLTSQTNGLSDRCQVLMARDTLMRQKLEKQQPNVYTDSIVVGTCPDMCPEFERYSRTEKNIISIFERKEGEVDPKAMVKEYSRSSADQKEPLPHHLRPVPVLAQTMDHLLWNVVGRTDISPGEWYDFIWDRTRGIRKDMTLQHPCDLASVALIEKCARFHIHCGFELVAEERSAFDPKINNDNLAECFQSLRQLYHDLTQRGLKCPAEMEFRGYDILFNLTEGGVLRKIQDFPLEVRGSSEMKFAISVLQCITSNNYLRFFRLARQATYLSACLLHRYFSIVRLRALVTMAKAYSRPNHPEMLPLEHLVELLAFEDDTHARNFCEHLGLQVEGSCVVLDRSALNPSPSLYPVLLGFQMVASKRQGFLGEIINGGPLPSNPYSTYCPHNSFDTEGRLRPAAFDASDQCKMATPLPSPTDPSPERPTPRIQEQKPCVPVSKFSFLTSSTRTAAPPSTDPQQLLPPPQSKPSLPAFSFLQAPTSAPAPAPKKLSDFSWKTSPTLLPPTFSALPQGKKEEVVPYVHSPQLPSARDQKEVGQKLLEEVVQEEVTSSVLHEVCLQDVFDGLLKDLVREVCWQHLREEWQHLHSVCTQQLALQIRTEVLGEMAHSTCLDVVVENFSHQHLEKEVDQELEELAQQYLAEVRAEQERRKCSIKHRLARKYFSRWMRLTEQRQRRARAMEDFPAGPMFATSPTVLVPYRLPNHVSYSPMENMERFEANNHLLNAGVQLKKQKESYAAMPLPLEKMVPAAAGRVFKLVVVSPEANHPAAQWICAKLSCGDRVNSPTLPPGIRQLSLFKSEDTFVSVQFVAGEEGPFQEALRGASGVFVLAQQAKDIPWARQLLRSLLPAPTLAIFHPGQSQPPAFRLTGDLFEDTLELAQAIHWMVTHQPSLPALHITPLRALVQEVFSGLVFGELASASPHIEVSAITALYNSVVRYLCSVLASPTLSRITWPPLELPFPSAEGIPRPDWNCPSRLGVVQETLLHLGVPSWLNGDDPWGFVEMVCSARPQMDVLLLRERVKHHLNKPMVQSSLAVPWKDILEECFNLLVDSICWKDQEGQPLEAHYLENELASFTSPPEWNLAVRKALLFRKALHPTLGVGRLPPTTPPPTNQQPAAAQLKSTLSPLGIHYQNEVKARLLAERLELERQQSRDYLALLHRLVEEGRPH